MPVKVSAGLSRKHGLPDYGSVGASCQIEFEVDHRLLEQDLTGFQAQSPRGVCGLQPGGKRRIVTTKR